MKKTEAAKHLRILMIAIQRYRSVVAEEIPDLTEKLKAKMWPWVFGDRCPIPALQKLLSAYEKDGTLEPIDYYNIRIVMYRFVPEVVGAFNILNGSTLPTEAPSTAIMMGWEDE